MLTTTSYNYLNCNLVNIQNIAKTLLSGYFLLFIFHYLLEVINIHKISYNYNLVGGVPYLKIVDYFIS
jgi:hypothetical protein